MSETRRRHFERARRNLYERHMLRPGKWFRGLAYEPPQMYAAFLTYRDAMDRQGERSFGACEYHESIGVEHAIGPVWRVDGEWMCEEAIHDSNRIVLAG